MSVHDTSRQRFAVIIPAHNEGRSISGVIRRIGEVVPGAAVVVIDDGSRDDTAEKAAGLGATVISLPFNMGYGAALHTGLLWAARNGLQAVVTMDADGQHEPTDIPKLLKPVLAGAADITLGSRYLPESLCYRVSRLRRAASWMFAALLSFLTGKKLTDTTTGFQCLGSAVLKQWVSLPDFPEKTPDADLILYSHLSGFRVQEVAVQMHEDKSKDSMHGPLKSLFYAPKMLVAILGILLAQPSFRRAGK
jgi:glycosyltransferase involved in cell wall biosynthesis